MSACSVTIMPNVEINASARRWSIRERKIDLPRCVSCPNSSTVGRRGWLAAALGQVHEPGLELELAHRQRQPLLQAAARRGRRRLGIDEEQMGYSVTFEAFGLVGLVGPVEHRDVATFDQPTEASSFQCIHGYLSTPRNVRVAIVLSHFLTRVPETMTRSWHGPPHRGSTRNKVVAKLRCLLYFRHLAVVLHAVHTSVRAPKQPLLTFGAGHRMRGPCRRRPSAVGRR